MSEKNETGIPQQRERMQDGRRGKRLTPLRQKGLKNVFDEAIRAVLAPADRGQVAAKKKQKKSCIIL